MAGFREGVGVTITGIKELDSLFGQLTDGVQKKVLRTPLREAAKVIQKQAVANAPEDTGALKRSIKVRAGKRSRKGYVRMNVVTGGDTKGATKIRGKATRSSLYTGKQFYGAFIEFGHHLGKRSAGVRAQQKKQRGQRVSGGRPFWGPKPFLRPAFDTKKKEAQNVAADLIAKGIVKEALALAGKLNAKASK